MTSPSANQKKLFRTKLRDWYSIHARDLPWRNTHDPYAIMVSELMLQQTQVDRVIPKFNAWIHLFPSVEVLAKASTKDILSAWQGLGYNRRALYLQKAAIFVVEECNGVFPSTKEALLQLPGVGPYTAGAIMSFAYKKGAPIVDTNVFRVLGRIYLGYKVLPSTPESTLWELSEAMVPKRGDAYTFNQAIMDFGAMQCTLRKPQCDTCPFQKSCTSYPDILDATTEELRYQKKPNEKKYFGQPRRIWRGKILKYLHTAEARNGASLQNIGTAIQTDYSHDREEWLQTVIDSMLKDSLIQQHKKGGPVSLP